MTVADILVSARRAAGLSQKDVAEALGISPTFLSDIERGRRAFGEKHLPALPSAMRGPVADALLAEHTKAIARIKGVAT